MPDPVDFIDPFDDCTWLPARELFRRLGFEPPPSSALDEFKLRGWLWQFIYALAGRRFFLHHTDHLCDRALYLWLHEKWFPEDVADIPPEAELNCRVEVTGVGAESDEMIWLRHFAAEADRRQWALDFGEEGLPPHEDPPHDRDRWLPKPPAIPPDTSDADLFPAEDDPADDSDPLGLEAVDAEIRAELGIENLSGPADGEPPEVWQRPIDQLPAGGANLLPPDELTDDTLEPKLWELLHNLACRGFYVLHTDHLNNRELYTELWRSGLREQALLPGKSNTGGWYHDPIGSGSPTDAQIWLRFYATDEQRARHAREWPEAPMPAKEKPAHNRDWRLPKGPF
jgi:hypothetical protein